MEYIKLIFAILGIFYLSVGIIFAISVKVGMAFLSRDEFYNIIIDDENFSRKEFDTFWDMFLSKKTNKIILFTFILWPIIFAKALVFRKRHKK